MAWPTDGGPGGPWRSLEESSRTRRGSKPQLGGHAAGPAKREAAIQAVQRLRRGGRGCLKQEAVLAALHWSGGGVGAGKAQLPAVSDPGWDGAGCGLLDEAFLPLTPRGPCGLARPPAASATHPVSRVCGPGGWTYFWPLWEVWVKALKVASPGSPGTRDHGEPALCLGARLPRGRERGRGRRPFQ